MVLDKSHPLKQSTLDVLLRSYDTERKRTTQNIIDVAAALVRHCESDAKDFVATVKRNAGYITGS